MIGDRLLRVAHHAFVIVVVVGAAIALSAQTVVDPQFVEFTASTDHNTTAPDGTAIVQRYSLTIYPVGSSVAFDTMDLGKPTPSAGIIRVDFLLLRHNVPTPGVTYEARVAAIGPGGSTASTVSNGFSFQAACAPTLNSTSQSVGSGATTGNVGVTAGAGCTWSAVSNAGWITLTGATGATGNGTVPYSVAANSTTSARSGTLTVAGQIYTVNQAALSCSYTLSSASQSVAAGGGTGSTNVTAPTGCAWTGVSNNTSWLTVTSGASGTGSGTVAFSATSNPNTSPRTGTITIGGQTFSVNQAAAACTYALVPASQSVPPAGATGSTSVTTLAGCAWTGVSNNTSWLTVTSGASGTGSGTVAFSATSNPNTSSRTGTITIGGQTFSVNQAAAACTYALVPASQSVPAAGATGSTSVTTLAGCAWTGVSNNMSWLTVTSGASGTGGGTVAFSAASNPNTSPRTGTITIGGQTFSVNQAAAACTYALVPTSQSVVAGGGTGSASVTTQAGCGWTGVSNDTSWLTVTSGASGTGAGTVAFSASSNPNTSSRTGTITIGGQTFSVNQAAAGCTFALVPASQSVPPAGATGSTSVTTLAGCAWTGVSNNTSWLTVTSGASGTGGGTVAFSAASNPNTSPRTGTITIGGQTFSVNQAAATCTYALVPTSQSVVAGGGTGSASVTTQAGCGWTGVSNDTSWLTVTSGASGTGAGTVAFNASSNPNTSSRTGTITIAGQTFTVTQAGPTCTYSLSPTSQSVVAGGSTGSTVVTAPVACAWTAVSNDATWLTVTNGATGSGNGSVSFSAASNVTVSPRTGTLTIGGQTFTVTQNSTSCAFSISPTSQSVPAAGDSGSATVTATPGCSWTTVSNATWITVTAGATGLGNGSASFTVAPSTLAAVRTGTLTIAGRGFTVTQAANTCSYVLTPASTTLTSAGGAGSIDVVAASGCAWVASTNQPWITVGGSGTASGSATYTVQPNTGGSRVGAVIIGTQVFTVTQSAGTTGCTFSISPTSASVAAAGGSGSTTVTAPAGCSWTGVSNSPPWLTLSSGATGTGAGSASFNATPNTTTSPRTGTLTVAGQTFTVTQAAAGCAFSISPTSQAVPAAGSNVSTTVTTTAGCSWTVVNGTAWITVTGGGSGSGSGSASFTVAPSTSTFARTGTLTIAGKVFTVTQAANTCSYTLTPTSATLTHAGGAGSVTVATTSGCAWAATTNQSWITVSGTGTASGSVSYTVQPNTGGARTGAISIGTQVFTVIQATPPVAPGGLRLIIGGQ